MTVLVILTQHTGKTRHDAFKINCLTLTQNTHLPANRAQPGGVVVVALPSLQCVCKFSARRSVHFSIACAAECTVMRFAGNAHRHYESR